jgi:iron complex outermembrane receptor protein
VTSFGQTKETDVTQQKQDTVSKNSMLLKEVIVTGNAITDPTLAVVKQDFSEKVVQPKSSGELFSDINGFSLIKRGNYAVDPSFRANQYEQLNVQYDGGTKAFNACPNRMDPITTLINPEEVATIEIIKGPFSVRYGNTFGGVINMVTQNGNKTDKTIAGSLSSGYESNGSSFVDMLQLSSNIKKMDFLGDLSYREYGNYEDGNQNEIPSSFRSISYGLKMGYDFTEQQRLEANFHQNFGRDVLHAGLAMDTDEDNSTIGGLDYGFKSKSDIFKGMTAKMYYSYVDHIMSNTNRPSFASVEAVAKVNATTYGGKLESEWDFIPKWKFFTGVDMVSLYRDGGRDRLVKKSSGVTLATPVAYYDKIWQDSYHTTVGTFAESKWIVSEKEVVTLGARVDFVTSDARDLDSSFEAIYPDVAKRNEANFSGTVSYKKMFSPNYVLELAYGRGTRAASIEERYISYFTIGRDSYEYVGDPNLKAEVNNQFEIGLTGKEKMSGIFNQIKFGGSVYYSIYENYILGVVNEDLSSKYSATIAHPKVFQNIDNSFKTGFEVFGDLKVADYFNFLTEVSYVYTENKDFNESLPLTPPLVTRLKLSYEKGEFWTSAQYTLTARQPKIAYSYDEIATDGYEVMDLKAGYKPVENVSIGVGVLNLFDQYYNDHLSFAFNNQADYGSVPITEPGRNFTLFVNYKF